MMVKQLIGRMLIFKVSNDDAGFKKIGSWVAKVGKDFETFVRIPLQLNGFCG